MGFKIEFEPILYEFIYGRNITYIYFLIFMKQNNLCKIFKSDSNLFKVYLIYIKTLMNSLIN